MCVESGISPVKNYDENDDMSCIPLFFAVEWVLRMFGGASRSGRSQILLQQVTQLPLTLSSFLTRFARSFLLLWKCFVLRLCLILCFSFLMTWCCVVCHTAMTTDWGFGDPGARRWGWQSCDQAKLDYSSVWAQICAVHHRIVTFYFLNEASHAPTAAIAIPTRSVVFCISCNTNSFQLRWCFEITPGIWFVS